MKRILVISFSDIDVSKALGELIKKNPKAPVLIPATENMVFVASAVKTAQENTAPFQLYFSGASEFPDSMSQDAFEITVCSNPIREILREVTPDDILALVWDDSIEAHMALHSVEDFGIEAWNISDELEPIEIESGDSDDLYAEMQDKLSDFIEVFAAYMTASIMEKMATTIDALLLEQLGEHPLDEE